MSLFFPREFETLVNVEGEYIVIEQYDDNSSVPIGFVRLTEHQFMEIFNREKHIRGMLNKEADQ